MSIIRILVPTDFSEASDEAFRYAQLLAEDMGGELHLLHLVPDAYREPWAAEAVGLDLDALTEDWVRDAEMRLQRIASALHGTRIVRVAVRLGTPPDPILAYAAEHAVDLVILGAPRDGKLPHWLRSSTAERIARRASCPVLVVPGGPPTAERGPDVLAPTSVTRGPTRARRILVPVDFGKHADEALSCGLSLGARWGATVHALHVYDPPWMRNLAYLAPAAGLTEELRRQAERKLASEVSRHHAGTLDVRTAVRVGDPFVEIVEYAEAIEAGLIVMGTHGRETIGRLLLGSVTEKVLRRAPCPILMLHEPAGALSRLTAHAARESERQPA